MKIILLLLLVFLGFTVIFSCEESSGNRPSGSDGDGDSDTDENLSAVMIPPVERQDALVLESETETGTRLFKCTPENGGRITEFSLNGSNILTDKSVHPTNWGSTFWTSPQSAWGWPPPSEIDSATYNMNVDEQSSTITLSSETEPDLGVKITKEFSAVPETGAVKVVYSIENTQDTSASFAPWEITRVAPGGLTFYPQGEGSPYVDGVLPFTTREGITWFQHTDDISGDNKLFSDGSEGWIAHTDGNLLLVKVYPDHPAGETAPEEGEIEIYCNSSYVEVEQQGPYTELAGGETLSFEVTWYLRELSGWLEPVIGSEDLLSLVKDTIGRK